MHDERGDELIGGGYRVQAHRLAVVLDLHHQFIVAPVEETGNVRGELPSQFRILEGNQVEAGHGFDDPGEIDVAVADLDVGNPADKAEHGRGNVHGLDAGFVGIFPVEGFAAVLGKGADAHKEYSPIWFNGQQFKAINEYDSFLRQSYGNYMELPPENLRVPKHKDSEKFYWK